MIIRDCILSENTLEHLKIVKKLLQKNSHVPSQSDVVVILLKYIVSNTNTIPLDDFTLIDQYFLEHPNFLNSFYNEVMMSAIFCLDS